MEERISTKARLDPERGTAVVQVAWGKHELPPKAFTLDQLRTLLHGGPEDQSVAGRIERIWRLPTREARMLAIHLQELLKDLEEGRGGESRLES